MNKPTHDWRRCEANICQVDPEPKKSHLRTWYPGEPICSAKPRKFWQLKQLRLARLHFKVLLNYPDRFFTRPVLERIQRVTSSTKGFNPDREIPLEASDPSSNKAVADESERT